MTSSGTLLRRHGHDQERGTVLNIPAHTIPLVDGQRVQLAAQLAGPQHLAGPHAAAQLPALVAVGRRAGSFVALGGVDRVPLLHFAAIFLLAVGAVGDAAPGLAVGAPLAGLRESAVHGPLAQALAAAAVLVAVAAGMR